jgi:hypothetical protein
MLSNFLGVSLRVGLYRASLRFGASTSLRLPLQSLTRFAIRAFMMLREIIAFYSDKIGKTEHYIALLLSLLSK